MSHVNIKQICPKGIDLSYQSDSNILEVISLCGDELDINIINQTITH